MNDRTVALRGVELAIAEAGVGNRPLLLLHGFTGAKEDFGDWLDPLAARGWHAVAPDHRGHGASSKPSDEDGYSFEILADDVLGLADVLGWDTFTLLGHSMGGMVAQFVALAVPGRLSGLVLMDTGPGPVSGIDPELVRRAVSIVREEGIDTLADLLAKRENALETPAHRRVLAERPGYAEFGDRKLRDSAPAMYAAMASRLADTPDRLDSLRGLPPGLATLVIVGEQDAPFITSSERMADAIPGASLAVISDAGHSPQFENPDGWWSALSGFLDRIGAGSPA